jgi:hypothetical protein
VANAARGLPSGTALALRRQPMLALNDDQLAVRHDRCRRPARGEGGLFLERVAARLTLRGRFTDTDLDDPVRVALRGLIQGPAS